MKDFLRSVKHYGVLAKDLARDNIYDSIRILRYSHGSRRPISQVQSQYRIRKAYHGIEKGLSLTNPRYRFGIEKIERLIAMVNEHISRFGLDSTAIAASSAIAAYDTANDTDFAIRLHARHQTIDDTSGGVKSVRPQVFPDAISFLKSRTSVRQYTGEEVPRSKIEEAVSVAQNAPSVCNRQGSKVWAFDKPEVLALQPGNSGFGHTAAWGLVVTSDLKAFSGSGERHQAWCDGGMFAMALLYGLHALGLGACPLAWTASPRRDREVRRLLNIPDNEVIVMFISVGNVADEYSVAKSYRKELGKALELGSF